MSDLISRQDAIRIASGCCHPANIAEELAKLPSAQPEIIRCKDCIHRPFDSEDTQGFEFPDEKCPCQCEDFWYSWRPNDEWFCANAERRTDAEIH